MEHDGVVRCGSHRGGVAAKRGRGARAGRDERRKQEGAHDEGTWRGAASYTVYARFVFLAELWRYPVNSLAGESLREAELGALGVAGDRARYVVAGGRIVDARSRPKLLEIAWNDPHLEQRVVDAVGAPASVVAANDVERFDILPLLVATDGAMHTMNMDRRRFRPNLLIGDVPGLAERGWEGKFLRIGNAIVGLHSLRQRCVVTTWDPDTHTQDREVLRRINRELDGTLALNAWTAVASKVRVGDAVEVIDGDFPPPALFGRLA